MKIDNYDTTNKNPAHLFTAITQINSSVVQETGLYIGILQLIHKDKTKELN